MKAKLIWFTLVVFMCFGLVSGLAACTENAPGVTPGTTVAGTLDGTDPEPADTTETPTESDSESREDRPEESDPANTPEPGETDPTGADTGDDPTPGESDPAVTDPAVTDPAVTDPAVTDPEVTEPEVTEPPVTDPGDDEPHEHTFSTDWSHNDTHHWYAATCGHTALKDGEAEHQWDAGVVTTEPTCGEKGIKTYTCTVCKATKTEPIDKLAHAFSPDWSHDDTYHWHAATCGHATETQGKVQHTWNAGEVTTEPTCGSEGVKTYTCIVCPATKTEPIERLAHTFSTDWSHDDTHHWHAATCEHSDQKQNYAEHAWDSGKITTEPTCGSEGVKTFTCMVCQETKTEPVAKLAHAFSTAWSSDGTYHWHAATCEHSDQISAKGAHQWDDGRITTEPTCGNTGVRTYTCTVCDATKTEDVTTIPHTYADEWSKDETGHWYAATCGHALKKAEAGHRFDAGQTVPGATCGNAGTTIYTCQDCGYAKTEEESAAAGDHVYASTWTYNVTHHWHAATCGHQGLTKDMAEHTWDAGRVTTEPTCGATGVRTYTCTVCPATKTEDIAKIEHTYSNDWSRNDTHHWHAATCGHTDEVKDRAQHTWNAGEVTTEPTCGATGVRTYTCTVCSATRTEDIAKLDHTYADQWSSDTHNHWHAATCPHTDLRRDQAAHVWDQGKITTAPTCGAEGVKTYTCTVCKATRTETVDKIAHTFSTAWSHNDTHHWHAATCGHTTLKDGEAVHQWDAGVVTTKPTCGAEGVKTYTCTVCKTTKTETIDKLAHTFSTDWSHDNTYHWHAATCGHATEIQGKAQHTWNAGVVTKEPTCGAEGVKTYTCVVCSATKTESVDKLVGPNVHTWNQPLDCERNRTCTVCGLVDPARGNHDFDQGSCVYCGKCDHTPVSVRVIRLKDHGGCVGFLTVRTCTCGEVSYLNNGIDDLNCVFEYDVVEETGSKTTTVYTCSICQLSMTVQSVSRVDGCTMAIDTTYQNIHIGNQVILAEAIRSDRQELHTPAEQVTELAEYSSCGGTISVGVCSVCHETCHISSMEPGCLWDPATSQISQNTVGGVVHTITKTTCPLCGMVSLLEEWHETTGICEVTYYQKQTIRMGNTLVWEYTSSSVQSEHDFGETTLEICGNVCGAEGYIVTQTCATCGYVDAYGMAGHPEVDEYLNMETYGGCAGDVLIRRCQKCQKITYIEENSLYCEMDSVVTQVSGHTVETRTCRNCPLTIRIESWESDRVECRYLWHKKTTLTVGSLTAEATVVEQQVKHENRYEYAFMGNTCEDGLRVHEVCTLCGVFNDYEIYGHDTREEQIDLSTYGACAGLVTIHRCGACDEITYSMTEHMSCDMIGEYDTMTDGQGIVHVIRTDKCQTCGLSRVEDGWEEAMGGCDYRVYTQSTWSKGTTTIFESTEYFDTEYHDYAYSFDMKGDSCEDGVTVTITCKTPGCDERRVEYVDWHETYEYDRCDLDAAGACGGDYVIYRCPCGREAKMEHYIDCQLQSSVGNYIENGIEYLVETQICETCGLQIKTTTYSTRDAATCTGIDYTKVVMTRNGTAVDTLAYHSTRESHDLITTSTLLSGSTTCEDGVRVVTSCRDCDYSVEDTAYWHVESETDLADLSTYGFCGGGHLVKCQCACGQIPVSVEMTSDCLCFMNYEYIEPWDSTLDSGDCYTWNSDIGAFELVYNGTNAWQYVCSDPYDNGYAICGKVVRYMLYFDKEDGCLARQYYGCQIGYYNNGQFVKQWETTVSTGLTQYVHTYVEEQVPSHTEGGQLVNGWKYTCACGSYYQFLNGYDSEGVECIKEITYTENVPASGKNSPAYEWYRNEIGYDGCTQTYSFTSSKGDRVQDTQEHYATVYETIQKPTCTQPGTEREVCDICKTVLQGSIVIDPIQHIWVPTADGRFMCTVCGLFSAVNDSGDILMEDLTVSLGGDTHYVVGYMTRSDMNLAYNVSLILSNGQTVALTGIDFVQLTTATDGVKAIRFSREQVVAAAQAKGYAVGSYKVCLTMTQEGGTETESITLLDHTVLHDSGSATDSFVLNTTVVAGIENMVTVTITPAQSGTWYLGGSIADTVVYLTDVSMSVDQQMYQGEYLEVVLQAGVTYTLTIQPLDSEDPEVRIPIMLYATRIPTT